MSPTVRPKPILTTYRHQSINAARSGKGCYVWLTASESYAGSKGGAKDDKKVSIYSPSKGVEASPMTPKQDRFVAEYLANGMNATKAAISGYSIRLQRKNDCVDWRREPEEI